MTAQPSINKEIKNRKTMRGTLYLVAPLMLGPDQQQPKPGIIHFMLSKILQSLEGMEYIIYRLKIKLQSKRSEPIFNK